MSPERRAVVGLWLTAATTLWVVKACLGIVQIPT